MPNKIYTKLRQDLRLLLKKDSSGTEQVIPGYINPSTRQLQPIPAFSPKGKGDSKEDDPLNLQRTWDWWINNNYDSPDSFRNRKNRLQDESFAYYNSPIFSTGVDLLSDETVQPDSQDDYIEVYAKSKPFEKDIKAFLTNIGLTQNILRSVAWDLALYGDSFFINSIDPKLGVTKIVPVSNYSITSRIEFSLSKANEMYQQKNNYFSSFVNKNKSLEKLFNLFKTDAQYDVSQLFEPYLFGFELGDLTVPPWAVTHFRRFSNESEFYPFGKPAFIHAIAIYRQLSSSMNLQAMGRILKFPLKHFKVQTDERMTEIEQWAAISEIRQEYANLGIQNTGKDEFTINDEMWTPDGLLELDIIENNIDVKAVADIEILQDQLLTAMRTPKGYIPIGDDNSWGDSGKALIQQSKVFGRMVYINQQALLDGIVNLINLHFKIIGKYENEEFQVSLPFPVVEETSERERMKSDSIRLASDILTNLGTALGLDRDEALPTDIVADVYSNYSFLDDEEIQQWIKVYNKSKEQPEEDESEDSKDSSSFNRFKRESIKKPLTEARHNKVVERYREMNENNFRTLYFEALEDQSKKEGKLSDKHFVVSSKPTDMTHQMEKWYEIFDDLNPKSLNESGTTEFSGMGAAFDNKGKRVLIETENHEKESEEMKKKKIRCKPE